MPPLTKLRGLLLLPLALLAGCNMVVLNPSGDIARQQGQLIVISTVLMLLIIVLISVPPTNQQPGIPLEKTVTQIYVEYKSKVHIN